MYSQPCRPGPGYYLSSSRWIHSAHCTVSPADLVPSTTCLPAGGFIEYIVIGYSQPCRPGPVYYLSSSRWIHSVHSVQSALQTWSWLLPVFQCLTLNLFICQRKIKIVLKKQTTFKKCANASCRKCAKVWRQNPRNFKIIQPSHGTNGLARNWKKHPTRPPCGLE